MTVDTDQLISEQDESIGYWRAIVDLAQARSGVLGVDAALAAHTNAAAYLEARGAERYPKRNAGLDRMQEAIAGA